MDTDPISLKDRQDMQALIGSGFGTMRFSEYVLLEITCAADARGWLQDALEFVWVIADLGPQKARGVAATKDEGEEAWSIAFTHHGLGLLGIAEDPDAPFPSEFRSGQADETRRKLLCEDPALCWDWGDVPVPARKPQPETVSILVARVHDGHAPRSNALLDTRALAARGLRVVRRVHGTANSFQTQGTGADAKTFIVEPFGFRDGMGQPKVQGLQGFRSRGKDLEQQADVPLGEFVLGHPNVYRERSHSPEVMVSARVPPDASFGRNGCYLAVQQILQDVDAFRKFEAACPAAGNGPTVVEKMIGRRKDGRPLQEVPGPLAFDADFGFRTNDAHGLQCPIGAHIRRANPRDSLLDSSEIRPETAHLHRMLRRSRPFASSGVADDPRPPGTDAPQVGMFFIAIVADLARQFEFVKRVWIGNGNFGNLCGEQDPLLGRSAGRRFTIPGQPTGSQQHSLPDLTQTQGGGYFFLPGRRSLQRIADGDYTTGPQAGAALSAGGTPSPAPLRSSIPG